MRDVQTKGELTNKERVELDKRALVKEYSLLKDVNKVMSTREGLNVLKWILSTCKVLDDAFTNSGVTAYKLGAQNIGKKIMCKLIDAGCEIKLTDLLPSLENNKIDDISNKIHKLNTEDTK